MKEVKNMLLAVMCMCFAMSAFAENPANLQEAEEAGKSDYLSVYRNAEKDVAQLIPYDYSFFSNQTLLAAYMTGVDQEKTHLQNNQPANLIEAFVFNKMVAPVNESMDIRLEALSTKAYWEIVLAKPIKSGMKVTKEMKDNTQELVNLCQKIYESNDENLCKCVDFHELAESYGLVDLPESEVNARFMERLKSDPSIENHWK